MAYLVSNGTEAVAAAKKWLGTPYCWGGGHGGPINPGACVDCSGLVNQVFGTSGNTGTQINLGTPISDISQAAPGDLIFFGPVAPQEPYHVGIYAGGGQMIDAPHTGTVVRYDSVSGFGTVDGIRRLVTAGNPSDALAYEGGNALFSYAQLEAVWIQAGGNTQYAAMAAAIAVAESSGDPNASNTNSDGSVDRGLWQINNKAHGDAQSSFDVMTNARAAISISNGGTNWRPWCTAYSDGACGTNGGCYQCPGSPYMTYYSPNTPPDYNVPINATNAAASPGSTGASQGSSPSVANLGIVGCVLDPIGCADSVVANAIKAVIKTVLTPLVQVVAGALGVTAGATLMILGFYMVLSDTKTGQDAKKVTGKAVRGAATVVAPESRLAGARVSTYERQMPSGQTQITTVVGRRRRGRYQQRSTTATYGRPGASPGAPGGPRRPRDDLRDEAASYGGPEEIGR